VNTNNEFLSIQKLSVNPVYNISPFTLLDYPDNTACIIWFAGCNMRCPYCYNPEIVSGKGKISYFETLKFIISRKGLLDGVVFSGGECTMHKSMDKFAAAVKKLGMLVKIDTNGSNPAMISRLIENQHVDYVALDFKATASKYAKVTGSALFRQFAETFDILNRNSTPFEVRTTVHSELLSTADLQEMINYLAERRYRGTYYLQNIVHNTSTLGNIQRSANIDLSALKSEVINIVIRN